MPTRRVQRRRNTRDACSCCTTTGSKSTAASSSGLITTVPKSFKKLQETVEWIEANRLECATFHILTPYPGTPLFAEMDAAGRILHRDWAKYDTGHVVFQPKQMTADQLLEGYAWCYDRLFSHSSIWSRRPADWRAVPAYLAMSYLYKRSNLLWYWLIRYNITAAVWRPLVEFTRWRHLAFRRRLAKCEAGAGRASTVVTAGV
jgi:hypothetical protein